MEGDQYFTHAAPGRPSRPRRRSGLPGNPCRSATAPGRTPARCPTRPSFGLELYVEAGVAGDGFDAGADTEAVAVVEDGPAGEVRFVILLQLHIGVDGAANQLCGIFQIVDVAEVHHRAVAAGLIV